MNILLANPPTKSGTLMTREGRCEQSGDLWGTVWPPLSLCTLGALFERNGHAVRVLDCPIEGIGQIEFVSIIESIRPQIVVLNVSTPTIEYDLSFPALIKKRFSDCCICAIGVHVSSLPHDVLSECSCLDVVIVGEPEETLMELAQRIAEESSFDDLLGTAVRKANEVISNPPRPFITNLDCLPVPAWHLVDINKYRMPMSEKMFLMVASGRGCPFECSFCVAKTYYGSKMRLRSPESVVSEMFEVQRRFGVSDFLFWTETFTLHNKQVNGICDLLIEGNKGIRWVCNSRVDTINLAILKKMKQAGCWMVSFGIESANQDVLNRVGKNIEIDAIYRSVYAAKEAGLQVTGHFTFGLPGETEKSLKEIPRLAVALNLDYAQFYYAVPFPGSSLYGEAIAEGWIKESSWKYFDQTIANLEYPMLSNEVIKKERQRAIRIFYLRPKQIIKILSTLYSATGIRSLKIIKRLANLSGLVPK